MKIVQVEYRELRSSNFNNVTVGAVGEVENDAEGPSQDLKMLQAWVKSQLDTASGDEAAAELYMTKAEKARRQYYQAERRLKEAQDKWTAIQPVLAAHGIVVRPDEYAAFQNMPF